MAYGDLIDAIPVYAICTGLVILLAYAFIKALEANAFAVIKFMAIIYTAGLASFGALMFYFYSKDKAKNDGLRSVAFFCWGFTAFIILALWCSWRRLRLIAAII